MAILNLGSTSLILDFSSPISQRRDENAQYESWVETDLILRSTSANAKFCVSIAIDEVFELMKSLEEFKETYPNIEKFEFSTLEPGLEISFTRNTLGNYSYEITLQNNNSEDFTLCVRGETDDSSLNTFHRELQEAIA